MTHGRSLTISPRTLATIPSVVLFSALACGSFIACSDANGEETTPKVSVDGVRQRADHDDAHGRHDEGADAQTHATRLLFSSTPAVIPPGEPVTWTLRILDAASGQPVPAFSPSHEKLMHLIVVANDLSWFNHLHPEYKGKGEFAVTTTLPRAGSYKLYADYTPKGGSQEIAQHAFRTGNAPQSPMSFQQVADVAGSAGWLVKETASRPEGEPEAVGGPTYRVAMMPMPARMTAGSDVMLHFQVRDANGRPLASLEPYLGAMGHAVLLSSDTKTYLHTHPMEEGMAGMEHGPEDQGAHGGHDHGGHGHKGLDHEANEGSGASGGSDVIFHTNFPTPGLYKVWGQFQHDGRIITAAFVLQVD